MNQGVTSRREWTLFVLIAMGSLFFSFRYCFAVLQNTGLDVVSPTQASQSTGNLPMRFKDRKSVCLVHSSRVYLRPPPLQPRHRHARSPGKNTTLARKEGNKKNNLILRRKTPRKTKRRSLASTYYCGILPLLRIRYYYLLQARTMHVRQQGVEATNPCTGLYTWVVIGEFRGNIPN